MSIKQVDKPDPFNTASVNDCQPRKLIPTSSLTKVAFDSERRDYIEPNG